MSATIFVRGRKIVVPVDQLAEALSQIQIYEVSTGQYLRRVEEPDGQMEMLGATPLPRSDVQMVLDFLRLIEDQEALGGASQQDVMTVLGAAHAKGIGSKAAVVNRIIAGAGFPTLEVYSNSRDPYGVRYWKPGPKLKSAIAAISDADSVAPRVEADSDLQKPKEVDASDFC